MTATAIDFTKRGNTVGFTADGEAVCGRYFSKTKTWKVWVDCAFVMLDSRGRTFVSKAEAREYAATLVDADATERLAWWAS